MKLYTGYFRKHSRLAKAYSIARSQPPGIHLPELRDLAPEASLLRVYKSGELSWWDYEARYYRQLTRLGAAYIENLLEDGMTLLCWEKTGKNCHRYVLARFLRTRGHIVEERP